MALDALLKSPRGGKSHEQWLAVWKNLRAQTMPPSDEAQPSHDERQQAIQWIEREVFQLDPANPDPGRVTIRRLNRTEYRNTIFDLFGIEFDVTDAFPADDTGYGFDTIGDVLSISPLLMEKYVEAAQTIMAEAIPPGGPKPPSQTVWADQFKGENDKGKKVTSKSLAFLEPAIVSSTQKIEHPGTHKLIVEFRITGSDEATSNSARLGLFVNGDEVKRRSLGWDNTPTLTLAGEARLKRGENKIELKLAPEDKPLQGENSLTLAVRKVNITGPLDGSHRVYPEEYRRIFFDGPPPQDLKQREVYARKILYLVASRAFRRPIDNPTLDRLTKLSLDVAAQPGKSFEQGIAHALTAVLVSPRFLFRAEFQPEPNNPGRVMRIDEFALASRLSYFLWSSAPDDELFRLASQGKLRESLRPQIDRMLTDKRGERFVESFVGQWLQTRDVETLNVDARRILNMRDREDAEKVFSRNVRRAMRAETEALFAHLVKENRSVLDLVAADYTFVNEDLAKFYGLPEVKGREMRQVSLPAESHRSGLLTHGSFLVVTSNPARTSPVKRGLFVLENLLGVPAPPPPPDVPELEQSNKGRGGKLTVRELLEIHRKEPLCASCHARMDPLGLALEEFNALGQWREKENDKPIETKGQLITGEKFANTRELGQIIATQRRGDFYRCLTEKLLTYALGRGVEYYDAPAVEKIVNQLESDGGKMRTLIYGIVESAPFQMRRGDGNRVN